MLTGMRGRDRSIRAGDVGVRSRPPSGVDTGLLLGIEAANAQPCVASRRRLRVRLDPDRDRAPEGSTAQANNLPEQV